MSDSRIQVTTAERQVLFVAPDNEATRRWGVYGCPDMYRAEDGSIIACDAGHMDTYDRALGSVAEPVAFRSTDQGRSWTKTDFNALGKRTKIFDLADGTQAMFLPKHDPVDLHEIGVKPIALVASPNEWGFMGLYRYEDIPREARTFLVRHRQPGSGTWETSDAILDMPELNVIAPLKAKVRDGIWQDVKPMFSSPCYWYIGLYDGCTGKDGLIEAPDGSWLSTVMHHPQMDKNDRSFAELICMASEDRGRTWRMRGGIHSRRDLTTFGATEEYSFIRLGNEILCAWRTDICSKDPHDGTLLSRSSDSGRSWTDPEWAASSSVTPHLVKLDNGVVALVYGRPGVHVRFSTDGCRTWSAPTSLIGKTKEEELASGRDLMQAKYFDSVSYSNTRVVITGPDRFLVLYTDFKHGGGKSKAIVVQEVAVAKN